MKKNPFVRARMYISALMLGAVFVGCVAEPEVETTITNQDVIETTAAGPACNGSLLCCNSVQSANSPAVASLAGLLGIVIPPVGLVGLACSPINVIGPGGVSCNTQPVCCTGNNFNGIIATGCTPVSL
jgi:Fungal hydrophobin